MDERVERAAAPDGCTVAQVMQVVDVHHNLLA